MLVGAKLYLSEGALGPCMGPWVGTQYETPHGRMALQGLAVIVI